MILNKQRYALRDETPDGGTPPVKTPEKEVQEPVTPVKETPVEKVEPEVKDPVKAPEKEEAVAIPEKKEEPTKLSRVSSLVEGAGLDMKVVAEYAKANDGKVDLDTMVALTEKHGEAVASLVAEQIGAIHTEQKSKADARDQAIYDQVKEAFEGITEQDGKETWAELAGWAKDNVSNEHRTDINKLLGQGGLAAKLAVQELVSAYKEAQGTQEFQEADLLEADATPVGSGGNITKQDYTRELNKLMAEGHQYGTSSEIAKLDARRSKSIQRGY